MFNLFFSWAYVLLLSCHKTVKKLQFNRRHSRNAWFYFITFESWIVRKWKAKRITHISYLKHILLKTHKRFQLTRKIVILRDINISFAKYKITNCLIHFYLCLHVGLFRICKFISILEINYFTLLFCRNNSNLICMCVKYCVLLFSIDYQEFRNFMWKCYC
jgi:hypothetical protein